MLQDTPTRPGEQGPKRGIASLAGGKNRIVGFRFALPNLRYL